MRDDMFCHLRPGVALCTLWCGAFSRFVWGDTANSRKPLFVSLLCKLPNSHQQTQDRVGPGPVGHQISRGHWRHLVKSSLHLQANLILTSVLHAASWTSVLLYTAGLIHKCCAHFWSDECVPHSAGVTSAAHAAGTGADA